MTLTRSTDPATTARSGDARRAAFSKAQSHSRLVRVLKFVLPALAGALAIGFVAYSWMLTPAGVSIDLGQSAFSDGKLVMENPRLDGLTKANQRYSMTARKAAQVWNRPNIFELEGIDARLPVSADNWASVTAASGIYNRLANTINLTSEVSIQTDDGMRATLQAAFINVEKGALMTQKPLDIALNGIRIKANWMWVGNKGKTLIFKDKVRMEIQPGRLRNDQQRNGASDGE